MPRFWADRRGVAAVELALIAPFLLLLLLGTVTVFDYYRQSLALERATATVADFMSRQTELPATFLEDRIVGSLEALVPNGDGEIEVRISGLSRTSEGFVADWIFPSTLGPHYSQEPLPYADLPEIAVGDTLVVTEVMVPQETAFGFVGLDALKHTMTVPVRPRFTRKIAGPY